MLRSIGKGGLYVGTALLVVVAAALSAGPHGSLIAAGIGVLAIGVVALIVAGAEGLGMALLGLCFFNAPYFRFFQLSSSSAISAIDPMLVLATILLLPRIVRTRPKAPLLFVGSAVSFIVIGYVAAIASSAASATAFEITQWAFLALMLPLVFMALELTDREISWFAILYVAGQMLSSAVALAKGPDVINKRYQGLAEHPNYFADGGMMAAALLLYLYHRPELKTPFRRTLWWIAMIVCLVGIYVSGCRAAALGMGVVFVLVPIVEKSSVYAIMGTLAVALGAVLLQPVAQNASQGSILARFTGSDGTGQRTTAFRLNEWNDALNKIVHSPFLGNGLSIDILSFHDNYLEIGAGIGIFGLAAYLLLLWSMGRGLLGSSVHRRLLYPVVAFAVFGLTEPGFKDRSNWLPMLLGIAVFHGYRTAKRSFDESEAANSVEPSRTPVLTSISSP